MTRPLAARALAALTEPTTAAEAAERLGITHARAASLLLEMYASGEIERVRRGVYVAPPGATLAPRTAGAVRQQRLAAARRAAGLCHCGEQPRPNRATCADCAADQADRDAARQLRARGYLVGATERTLLVRRRGAPGGST